MNPYRDPHLPGATAIVLVMAGVLLLPWLGETLFNSKGEPREALVAVSILNSGDWILPRNFGTDIPFKPPFVAWIIAIFAKIFNGGEVNEYISRLPSALACFGMITGGYFWARSVRGTRFAIIFSFVTLTSIEVLRAAVACRLDMVLTACMVGALYVLYNVSETFTRKKGWYYTLVILLLTCATLTKGPVGALLPCLAFGIYSLLRGRRFMPTFFGMIGIAVASMIIPALWYYAAYQQGGQEFIDLMLEENFGRLTGTMSYESHSNPFWYNFETLALGLLPWTLLLVFSLFCAAKWRRGAIKPSGLLAIVTACTVIIFYCIPESKRSVYLLPAYPFICYGIAALIDSSWAKGPVRAFTWIMAILAILAPSAVVVLQQWPQLLLPMLPIPWWRYAALILPVIAGAAWIINRHSPTGHLLVIVWSLYMAYLVAAMPSVLGAKSDITALQALKNAPQILSYGSLRPYTINFYLNDKIHNIKTFEDAAGSPAGTMVIIRENDTADVPEGFVIKPLVRKSCDTRRPLMVAIKQ